MTASHQTPSVPAHASGDSAAAAKREWKQGIILFAAVVCLILFLTNFVFRAYQVSGQSMDNTLQNGNRLIIWKGSRTLAHLTGKPGLPSRGDIIVFNQPDAAACGHAGGEQLIKRVIGLPGDRVVLQEGAYTVYNAQHPDGFNPDDAFKSEDGAHEITPTPGEATVTLGSNQLFVSGDNRPNSCDSRAFGPISVDQVVGTAVLRYGPIGEAGSL